MREREEEGRDDGGERHDDDRDLYKGEHEHNRTHKPRATHNEHARKREARDCVCVCVRERDEECK